MAKKLTEEELEATRERLRNYVRDTSWLSNTQPSINLEESKSSILGKLKTYLSEELPAKKRKRNAEFIKKAMEATDQQISFGKSPSVEKGYLYGNVSAKAENYTGDATYYRTISVDLQTPEYVFFNADAEHSTCVAAFKYLNYLKEFAVLKDKYYRIYKCDAEAEALNGYAEEVCGEQFRRIDYDLTDTRVNDATYVQTEEPKDCNFYPVYLSLPKVSKKKILIGYYDAEKDSVFHEIDFPMPSGAKKWIVGIVAAAIMVFALLMWIGIKHEFGL